MVDLVPATPTSLAPLDALADRARAFVEASKAPSTRRAYQHDWQDFTAWCDERRLPGLPADPSTVAWYISDLASRYTVSTITRRLASISQAHQLAGYSTPTQTAIVRTTMQGIRRTLGSAQKQVAPAVTETIRAMVRALPDGLLGQRDRALLLLGFAGAFRRSELVSLDVADLQFLPEGLVVTLRRSKTDQEGRGTSKAIPMGQWAETCPVRALKTWLKAANITKGPIFRAVDRYGHISQNHLNDRTVARVVKRSAAAAGFDPDMFSGHSLRAGLATSAAGAGVSELDIAEQTGHKSSRALRGYIRRGKLFRSSAAGKVGL